MIGRVGDFIVNGLLGFIVGVVLAAVMGWDASGVIAAGLLCGAITGMAGRK
jgi:hypothetical protein